jgi:hypothetical protein
VGEKLVLYKYRGVGRIGAPPVLAMLHSLADSGCLGTLDSGVFLNSLRLATFPSDGLAGWAFVIRASQAWSTEESDMRLNRSAALPKGMS